MPNCYYRVSVKALVLDEQKRFLLMKEENGMWDFPGGGLDFGEEPTDSLARELREEAGFSVVSVAKNPSYFITAYMQNKDVWFANVFYQTILKNLDFISSDECVELRFFTPEEALKENIFSKVKQFIKVYDPENHNI
jgi:8-oxo-dGTP diphosphatase